MKSGYQRRFVPVCEFRATPDGVPGRFEAVVLTYNVVDDYRTIFLPDVFNDSMDERMPRVVWAHDWSEPLGRYTKYTSTKDKLTLVGEFDSFEDVPQHARQAHAQLKSGTIDQFSVGFMPTTMTTLDVPLGEKQEQTEKIDAFVEGRLDEVSLVLVGAVPGTELVSVRVGAHPGRPHIFVQSRGNVVDVDLAAGVLLDLQTGSIDLADALMALKNGARPEPPAATTPPVEPGSPPAPLPAPESDPEGGDELPPPPEVDELLEAEIAEALETVGAI